jgi:hypothetical protein
MQAIFITLIANRYDIYIDICILLFDIYIESHKFSFPTSRCFHIPTDNHKLSSKLALDKGKRLRAILVNILLVRVCIVSGAAVGVSRIAVALDYARAGRLALEASRTGSKLYCVLV